MRTRLVVLFFGVTAATFLACHEAPTAPITMTLQLDRGTYVAVPLDSTSPYAFRVVVRYRNGTSAPIYFALCRPGDSSPVFGVPTNDGGSLSGYDQVWACVGTSPLEFPPGAVRTDSLLIQGPNAYDGGSHEPLGVLTGSFRLEYQTQRCAEETPACAQAGPREEPVTTGYPLSRFNHRLKLLACLA
jgi:hypothetical protein